MNTSSVGGPIIPINNEEPVTRARAPHTGGSVEGMLQSVKASPNWSVDRSTIPPTSGEQAAEFVKVAAGAVKQVWKKRAVQSKVFYTPLKGKHSAKKELESEITTAGTIRRELQKAVLRDFLKTWAFSANLGEFGSVEALKAASEGADERLSKNELDNLREFFESEGGKKAAEKAMARGGNLAVDMRVVGDSEKIEGLFTVETSKADGDLEKFIRGKHEPEVIFDCAAQVLNGMADLHKAGYVHGDVKPENVLFTKKDDGTFHFTISDWGKTKPMTPDKMDRYEGNPRFAPWENRLSMAGDVCATGIKLIRIFEEMVLAKTGKRSLIEPDQKGRFIAAEKRRGFEVFVIESKDFNAVEQSGPQVVMAALSRGKNMVVGAKTAHLEKMEEEKNRYIDALVDGMGEMGEAVGNILKSMTDIDPSKRKTMQQYADDFEKRRSP